MQAEEYTAPRFFCWLKHYTDAMLRDRKVIISNPARTCKIG